MAELFEMLTECGAIKFGRFVLTSGKESSYYVDIKAASTRPRILRRIAEEMAARVDGTRVAGMELGAVPIATAVALQADLPFCILRKKPREHGTGSQIEGEVRPGETVTVVEDVATTGGSIVQSVRLLRAAGAVVNRAIVVVDREEGAAEALRAENVELVALVKRSRLMEGKA
ncbi:MAG: orotate phosphoribosyltransferase [Euryarchaeota archaeon]|nr:orotate phosphoribosyltransferase [Euryarchaeota archaeon]